MWYKIKFLIAVITLSLVDNATHNELMGYSDGLQALVSTYQTARDSITVTPPKRVTL